jgi:hypothetical protein
MQNTEVDFYSGYEGDDEIIFTMKSSNCCQKKLRIWDGYFHSIINQVKLSDDGSWPGLAYYYHLRIGWYEEDNWQIPNINEALLQFKNICLPSDRPIYEISSQVLVEIINILSEAVETDSPIFIQIE